MNWVDGLFALGASILKDIHENNKSGSYDTGDDNDFDNDDYKYESNRYERFADGVNSAIERKHADIEKRAREDYKNHVRQLSDAGLRNALSRAEENDNRILADVIRAEMSKREMY